MKDAPDRDRLAALGARTASAVRGQLSRLAPLFQTAETCGNADVGTATASDARRPGSVPKAAILRFLANDLYKLIDTTDLPADLRHIVPDAGTSRPFANAMSGHFDLASVYGAPGLVGDLTRQLFYCIRHPWEPAKFWLNDGQHLPTLEQLVHGDGAVLTESFFFDLPPHLRAIYVVDGDLCLKRSIVPDMRNAASAQVARLHQAIMRGHNAQVSRLLKDSARRWAPEELFACAKERMIRFAKRMVRKLILPSLCDPIVLEWSLSNNAPVHAGMVARHGGHALPLEGAILLGTLSCGVCRAADQETELQSLRTIASRVPLPGARAILEEIHALYGFDLRERQVAAHSDFFDFARMQDMPLADYLGYERRFEVDNRLGPLGSLILAETVIPTLQSGAPAGSNTDVSDT